MPLHKRRDLVNSKPEPQQRYHNHGDLNTPQVDPKQGKKHDYEPHDWDSAAEEHINGHA